MYFISSPPRGGGTTGRRKWSFGAQGIDTGGDFFRGGPSIRRPLVRPTNENQEARQSTSQRVRLEKGTRMSRVRVLVGTRKGAFVLEADGKRENWEISGPHFAGWEIYHMKGSPAAPQRIFAAQNTSWFGQLIQRSDDGGKTW